MTTADARDLAAEVARMLEGLLAAAVEGEIEADVSALAFLSGAQATARLIAAEATPHRAAGRLLRASQTLSGGR